MLGIRYVFLAGVVSLRDSKPCLFAGNTENRSKYHIVGRSKIAFGNVTI